MLMERILGKKVKIRGEKERLEDKGKRMLLVVMEEKDKDEVLEKRREIEKRWGMIMDEDLTREERKMKWRIKEKAMERRRGRRVEYDNRKIWIEGTEWKWDEELERWREGERDEDRRGDVGG
ncbi:hypothetical protein RF55_20235 [Lasius niger]|uniref:Uncharacterized protein n=1 Tax=Lasius niger TaxID=67767 RepID=A0A0J7JZ87_LASNI|nr:hypothetical protein RF55_20235 [Lasius niger]